MYFLTFFIKLRGHSTNHHSHILFSENFIFRCILITQSVNFFGHPSNNKHIKDLLCHSTYLIEHIRNIYLSSIFNIHIKIILYIPGPSLALGRIFLPLFQLFIDFIYQSFLDRFLWLITLLPPCDSISTCHLHHSTIQHLVQSSIQQLHHKRREYAISLR